MGAYVIWSIEHDAWWRADGLGYTFALSKARRYTRNEAEAIVRRANTVKVNECMIPVAALEAGAVPGLGATGGFPFGRLGRDDEGELQMALAADRRNGIVRVEFGKPIAWLGLPSWHARELARALLDKAEQLDRLKS